MSAWSQKQTSAVHQHMSALPQIADSALGQYQFKGSEVPSRLDSKANIAVSLGMSSFGPMAGHGPPHSITSSARAGNLQPDQSVGSNQEFAYKRAHYCQRWRKP